MDKTIETTAATLLHDGRVRVGALVCCCFLLGSTGWLAWLYRIAGLADPQQADLYTMVLGYLAQAVGVGVYMAVRARMQEGTVEVSVIGALVAYIILLEPAAMSDSLAPVLGFGYVANVLCGYFQGHYLSCLAEYVAQKGRGLAFGAGYAVSTLATWLLSSVNEGVLATGTPSLFVYVVLALLSALCVMWVAGMDAVPVFRREDGVADRSPDAPNDADAKPVLRLLALTGATVVVVSMVKGTGFAFPTADLSGEVDLELSRLFYGVGLVIAGIAADRERRYAFVCCVASLMMPFLTMGLAVTGAPGALLWVLGYLLFGFFAVFRVVIFADLAEDVGHVWIAGAGLALGRVGDALGTALCLAMGSATVTLVLVTGVGFVAAVLLLFALFSRLYVPMASEEPDEGALLAAFGDRYSLTERERDVLPFLVAGLTNVRIAQKLSVSEPTVKFHVRNILKKTGCNRRSQVIERFDATRK